MDKQELIVISSFVFPLFLAITLHEAAHAFAANKLGDPTARLQGRMSLDPLKHVDPVGTILLPGLMLLTHVPAFGYAKPVPVDFGRLRRPRLGMILVAFAGPAMNLLLAFLSALLLHMEKMITPEQAPWTFANLYNSVTVNCVLAAFNMLPILPLDGGRVLNGLLPPALAREHAKSERFGMFILMALLVLPGLMSGGASAFPRYLIGVPANILRDGVFHAAGIGNG